MVVNHTKIHKKIRPVGSAGPVSCSKHFPLTAWMYALVVCHGATCHIMQILRNNNGLSFIRKANVKKKKNPLKWRSFLFPLSISKKEREKKTIPWFRHLVSECHHRCHPQGRKGTCLHNLHPLDVAQLHTYWRRHSTALAIPWLWSPPQWAV